MLYELLQDGGQVRVLVDVAVAELLGRVEGHEADGRDAIGAAGVVEFNSWIQSSPVNMTPLGFGKVSY